MNDAELDVILFDYRGLKFTYRKRPLDQDADGDEIEDYYYDDAGNMRSHRIDSLLQDGDVLAETLAARNAALPASPLVGAALAHGATPTPPVPTMPTPPSAPPPPASAEQAPELCPEDWCRQPVRVKDTKSGPKIECTNPNHLDTAQDGRQWPHLVRWVNPPRRGR